MPTSAATYAWMPEPPLRNFSFFPGELEVYAQKEPLPNGAADWAERHYVVSRSSRPGPWRHRNAPYFYGLMKMYSLPWVREMDLPKGSQTGGSEFIYATHGYDVDYEPGDTIFVMPSRETAKDVSLDRVDEIYKSCDALRKLKSRNPDDQGITRKKLKNGVVSYFAWAGSDAALASKPLKYGKIDETDLIGLRSINLVRARFRTYLYEYKLLLVSKTSVETGPIWEAFNSAHVKYDYKVPCPHCGHTQVMTFAQFGWTEGVTDPRKIEITKDAWYECESCSGRWDEYQRDQAVLAAMEDGWTPRRYCAVCEDVEMVNGLCPRCEGSEVAALPEFPEKIGAHLPAFYSPYVPFYTIVADYLRYLQDPHGKTDDDTPPNAEKFWCDDCALPMPVSHEGEVHDETALYKRRESYGPKGASWQVPMAAVLLTCGVDVQGNRLELEVIAWGANKQTWGIEHRVISGSPSKTSTWDELEKVLEKTYLHESGVPLRVAGMGIDSGGHHTEEVYKFCRKWKRRRVFAFKGANVPGKPIRNKPTEIKRHRIFLYTVGTEAAKDNVSAWLQNEQPGPYYQHFPEEYGFEYFRQLCAEEPKSKRDSRGRMVRVWQVRKGYSRNEALDLRVLNLAVYENLNPNIEKLAQDLGSNASDVEEHAGDMIQTEKPQKRTRARPDQQGDDDDERQVSTGGRSRPGWYKRQ